MLLIDGIIDALKVWSQRKRLERMTLDKYVKTFESIWNNLPGQSATWFDMSSLYSKNEQGELVVNFTPDVIGRMRSEARYLSYFDPHAKSIWRKFQTYVLGAQGFRYVAEPIDPNDKKTTALCERINKDWARFMEKELWWDRENEIARRVMVDGEAFIETFKRGNRMATMRFIDPERVCSDARGNYPYGVVTDPQDAETHTGYIVSGVQKDARNILQLRTNAMRNMPRGVTEFTSTMNMLKKYENLMDARLKLNILRSTIVLLRKFSGKTPDQIKSFISNVKTGDTAGGTPYESKYPGTILNSTADIDYEMLSPNIQGADAQYDRKAFMQSIAAGSGLAYYAMSGDSNDNKYAGALTAESPMLKELVWWQMKFVWDFTRLQERLLLAMGYTPDELEGVRLNAYPADIESKDIKAQAEADEIYVNMGAESLTGVCKRRGRDYEEVRLERETEEAQMPAGDNTGDEQ